MNTGLAKLTALEVLLVVLFTCVEKILFAQLVEIVFVVVHHLVDVEV